MAAADDIIQGNQDARNGLSQPPGSNKYYAWGYAEGKRYIGLKIRVEILEDHAGLGHPADP